MYFEWYDKKNQNVVPKYYRFMVFFTNCIAMVQKIFVIEFKINVNPFKIFY